MNETTREAASRQRSLTTSRIFGTALVVAGLSIASAQAQTITYIQGSYATPQSPQTSVSVVFTAAQSAHNLNVVAVGWNDSVATVTSVTDSSGNIYQLAVGPTIVNGFASQSIYYAKNIVGAAAGANVVTVQFSTAAKYADIRILEYSGADLTAPVDVVAARNGTGTTSTSGAVTTTNARDLLFGANLVATSTRGPGSGFTARLLTSPDGDIAEDRMVTSTGSYSATAPVNGGKWIMQMVAFRTPTAASDTSPPTAPGTPTLTVVSSSQINLTWATATDNIGVTGYRVERCQGADCTAFVQIAAPASTAYNDTGLTANTSYSYRVRAIDAAGNLGPYSNVSTATTQPDTQAPTAPGNLTATAVSDNQINVSWIASTDNVGVTGYRIARCQGSGCTNFTQIATTTGTTYTDTGLTASTSYSYQVNASDAAGNLSPYSNIASATTSAVDAEPPTAPGNLTATPVSGSQINLSWTASTDNVGVTGYRVERCQGADCVDFARIGTPTGTTFSDTGLTPNTTYRYQVRASDAAGNLSPYSSIASATTNATFSGLVAAYSFNEGTGTAVADSSGNGNTGTIAGAAWTTAGRYGGALSFNGGARINITDSASLRLTTGMTLEAWVNPTAVNSAWRDVIYKGNDNYFLEATSTSGGAPAGGGTFGSAGAEVYGTASIPTNTWTHLAVTYDGAKLQLYINGSLAATRTQTGNIATSTNPLQIGGDSIYGQYFAGLIDEVRVYNTALTASQIQTDMTTPIGAGSLPAVSLSTNTLTFASQAVGTTSIAQAVTINNTGSAPLTITSVTITGVNAIDFGQSNNCGTSIAAGGACNVSVTFTPTQSGSLSATLSISDNAPGSPQTVSLSGAGVTSSSLTVTPRVVALTFTRTQQFTASSSSVTWSVDGVPGGSSSSGTITGSGVYTPPASIGVHTITATLADGSQSASATAYITNYAGSFTHHNDNFRTGQNLNETVLTLANVSPTRFGKLFSYALDGIAYASPLYVANVDIPGQGFHNVVYVATEHNSVYAFDADGLSANALWKVSFLTNGATTVPAADTGECCDIAPEIGITGTPVIDPSSGTLYVVAKTKESGTYVQRLHALDIATGAEKFGGPVVIQASVPGTGSGSQGGRVPFDALHENQRPALLLSNGVVYIAFAGHGDVPPYHGWVLGYNALTLQQVMAFNATPNASGAGIWMGGGGPAADANGNIYFITANGGFDVNTGGIDYGDTFVKISPSGSVLDYFTPHDQRTMDTNNLDLASGGPMLLPDQPGPNPHLMVGAGKTGTIYVINRDNMGHYNSTNDGQIVQSLVNIFPNGTPEPGNDSIPVYFNGTVYFSPINDKIQAFQVTDGLLSTTPTSRSSTVYAFPGGGISVSANGSSDGILWAVERPSVSSAGVLHAYDASNLGVELYNSNMAGTRDVLDVAAKFNVPLVANGKVFVASNGRLTVYGLLP
jgi:chitodextrinase